MRQPKPLNAEQRELAARKADLFHQATLYSTVALLVLFALRFFVLLPVENASNVVIFSFLALPLVLFLVALKGRRPRTYAWFCFIVLFYFMEGSVGAFALPSLFGVIALLEALLASALFISAMYAARYKGMVLYRPDMPETPA